MKRSTMNIIVRLLALVTPLTGHMFIAIVTGVLGFICASFVTVLGGYLMISVYNQNPLTSIITSMFTLAVLRGILHYIEHAFNHYIAFKLLAIIRSKVFAALRRVAPAKLENKSRGDLISMITGDIELLEIFFAHTISPVCIAFVMFIFNVWLFNLVHVYFAIIASIGYVFVGIIIPIFMSKATREIGLEKRTLLGKLNNYFLDRIRGLQEVLQFNQSEAVDKDISLQTSKLQMVDKKLKSYLSLTMAMTNTCIIGFSILIGLMGVYLLQNQLISLESFVLSILLMYSSFGPFVALANLGGGLSNTLACGHRILDLLDEQPIVEEVINGNDANGILTFNNVSFKYENELIVSNQSFEINENKIFGISGKSGSGKSTMLNLMMRFFDVNSGSINIGNHNIKDINTSDLRNYQSYVTQQTHLFNDTIENNLKIAKLDASLEEVIDACKKASIHDFILSLKDGYQTNVGELGDLLSGGQKQRLGLARAFLHDSQLMLLDEPTSNLDVFNEAMILKSLKDIKDKTVVLVSHRPSTLNICDDILKVESTRNS